MHMRFYLVGNNRIHVAHNKNDDMQINKTHLASDKIQLYLNSMAQPIYVHEGPSEYLSDIKSRTTYTKCDTWNFNFKYNS